MFEADKQVVNRTLTVVNLVVLTFIITLVIFASEAGIPSEIAAVITSIATVVLAVVTLVYVWHTSRMARTMAAQTEADLLLRLHEIYSKDKIYQATDLLFCDKQKLWTDFPENRYQFGEDFLDKEEEPDEDRLDRDLLRWHLVNFWYTLAVAIERDFIDDKTIYDRFGSPEVIEVLEPIETVKAYRRLSKEHRPGDQSKSIKVCWAPLRLFCRWAAAQDDEKWQRRMPVQQDLPGFPDEFKRWVRQKGEQTSK